MVTVIVIPVEGFDGEKLFRSLPNTEYEVIWLKHPLDFNVEVETEWKIFFYANEHLEDDLKTALPLFVLLGKDYDFFSLYSTDGTKYFLSPRLFKKEIEIEKGSVYPVEKDLKQIAILDGFIRCD